MSDGTETYAAARVGDPIAHSHALGGFIAGALVGVAAAVGVAIAAAAIAGAVAAEVVTAGLATPLVAGAAVAAGELVVNLFVGGWLAEKAQEIGESLGSQSHNSPSGLITVGDPGIIINDKPAAVVESKTSCDNSTVAQGSSTVFFNGMPAARINDKVSCGGAIIQGSGDVLIGSPPVTVGTIADEVPNWVRWAAIILPLLPGIGQALRSVGKGLLAIEAQGFSRAMRIGAKTVARNLRSAHFLAGRPSRKRSQPSLSIHRRTATGRRRDLGTMRQRRRIASNPGRYLGPPNLRNNLRVPNPTQP